MNAVRRLPADVAPLVGRSKEVRTLRGLLGRSRLVSVTGPGGVGKSRVAIAAARSAARVFPDGTYYVDLSDVHDPVLVPAILDNVLGVAAVNAPAEPPPDWRGLMLIDNAEHLIDACARAIHALLEAAPEAQVVVTTRERLAVAGEHVMRLTPLEVPPENATLADLLVSPSVQFLVDRGQAVSPDFEVTAANAADIIRLSRTLEGLPLAIELAAARLEMMSIRQIADLLVDPGRLLGATWRTHAERQTSLESTIAWSYDLCSPAEQQLWSRMSIFGGAVDLAAVTAVCADPDPSAAEDLWDLIDRLVAKSIVVVEQGEVPQFRLPAAIGHYGARQLDAQDRPALRDRHVSYFQELARRSAAEWFGPDQIELSARLRAALPDLRLALDALLSGPDPSAGAELAALLHPVWLYLGRLQEGEIWLERAVQAATRPVPMAALWYGWLLLSSGRIAAGRDQLEWARTHARDLGDERHGDLADLLLGMAEGFDGRFDAAVAQCSAAVDRRRAAADPTTVAPMLTLLAELLGGTGHASEALAACDEAEAICRDRGELWVRSLVMRARALAYCLQGDFEQATAIARESLEIKARLDDRAGVLLSAEILCWAWAATGRWVEAARLAKALDRTTSRSFVLLEDSGYLRDQRRKWHDLIEEGIGAVRFEALTTPGDPTDYGALVELALGGTGGEDDRSASGRLPIPQDLLTKRELEVAELVAAGLSNREVANRLVISLRTAEVHVGRILVKLGFNSRTQIAAWWHEVA